MTLTAALAAYVTVGACYAVTGIARGLYRLDRHEVTTLHAGGSRETRQTRAVGEFAAGVGLALLAWPIFPAFAVWRFVVEPSLARRFERHGR